MAEIAERSPLETATRYLPHGKFLRFLRFLRDQ